jgi:Ras GTPase-activating protein 1
LNLTIVSRGKRNKDSEVAELSIDLAGLKNGQETEEWYPLNGMTPMGEWGSIRLRIRYLDDLGESCWALKFHEQFLNFFSFSSHAL